MADNTYTDVSYSVIKREVRLYAAVDVAAAGAVTLLRWNYPQMGQTAAPNSTYTAASVLPTGNGFPQLGQTGAEGIRSVTRTAAGLWTVKFQSNFQRVMRVDAQGQLAGGLSAIVGVGINSTLLSMAAVNGSEVGIALLSATATALDPAAGTTMLLTFTLADSTTP